MLFTAAEGNDRYARDSALAALALSNLSMEQRQRLRYIIEHLAEAVEHEQKGFSGISRLQGAVT